ncbi:MAG: ribonuclease P protein component [Alphaproteobacteria bacterium]|nr:ribonuclease P protein component [Alphaproteobacteria bacterium]
MTKILTFKKRKDFLRVAQGAYVATRNMVLQAAPSLLKTDNIMVGYTATKKIGNAVTRNKSKRRLRAVVREILIKYALEGIDYVFIARNSTAACDYKELRQDTVYALKRINKNFLPQDEVQPAAKSHDIADDENA